MTHEILVKMPGRLNPPIPSSLEPAPRKTEAVCRARFGLLCWLLVSCWVPGLSGHAGPLADREYEITHYELRGNTALDPETVRNLFAQAVGPAVSLSCICRALASLRQAYQERGYSQVAVALPEQRLTGGIVFIDVVEGDSPQPSVHASAPRRSATTADPNHPASPTFEVRRFEVTGDTLLGPAEVGRILGAATGPSVTLDEVRKAAISLQRAYRERGYVTVAVTVPSQRLTNATVRLRVTEGALTAIHVLGNRYFSSNNIARALPSLRTNTLLNSQVLQRELDLANQNRDRQIYPMIGPGPEPGTSALALRVQDRLPLHANLELDNYSTPGTPDLRVNFAAQYNNLWQQEHQFGLAYSFSPQELKTLGNTPNYGLNQPLISSCSAFYRLPIQARESADESNPGSTRFGYQEATHQFRLPPARAVSEWIVYASASSSDTGVKWGHPSVVSQSSLLSIVSQDSGENLTANQNVGSQARFPLPAGEHSTWSAFLGGDFKRSELSSFNTNNFFITTITTNVFGAETNRSLDSTNQPADHQAVVYFPLNAGLEFAETDAGGSTAVSAALGGNVAGSTAEFSRMAYSQEAKALFAKATLSARREQQIPGGISLLARANGQAATGPLINNEQFALGGINSVRGYYEGDEYGDCGWCGSLELRSPYVETRVAGLRGSLPAWVRASAFTDFGQRFLLASSTPAASTRLLCGTGFGLSANINNHLDARVVIAWPLVESVNTPRGDPRAYFTIGCQF